MINKRDFVFTGMQHWQIQIGSNAKDIALEISKDNRVFYINTPLDILTFRRHDDTPENVHRRMVVRGEITCINKVNENLYVLDLPFTILPNNFMPDGILFDMVNKWNNRKIYTFVKSILKEYKFEDHILFIDNDIYRSYYAREYLKPEFSIYYRRDNFREAFWIKHAPRLERNLCAKVDMVLTNSEELGKFALEVQPNTYCVGQGVDLSNYIYGRNYDIPYDIKDIDKPIIGYVGVLTTNRLDIKLMYELALHFKDISFVFVGPEDEIFINHDIHKLRNVFFLGKKDPIEIPNYLSQFDICINPQIINEITIGNYPRKIDEYLSLGKRVVATRTHTMKMFEDYCHNCDNLDDYIKAISNILSESDSEAQIRDRIHFAQSHSWSNCIERIYSCINNNYKGNIK